MRRRTLALATASGAALLAAAALPATAQPGAPRALPAAPGAGLQEGSVSAADLLAKLKGCSQLSNGKYRTDEETSATVPVCGKNGAVFWKADMDVDCDGQTTSKCNADTDPWYQDDTAFRQSNGKPLNAEKLPYVVVPSSSGIWNYASAGIKGGGVVAVIYNNQVEYAVVGDTGPDKIIGEASYAAAKGLGINPDPENGGADSGVTYVLFKNSKASPIESHADAVSRGDALAKKFLQDN
ncbi:glycoside hydrolase family 75 protein [Streptomyces lydicus]|uniref:glycoside hydrolase family 75 protein n=1 Tax=Streptomyces lydicus TaxID=47763 RepID=UPI0005272744|nr:glycoside hydrolase family 75 protein [Streptomyces lydicus]MDC7337608.1 glycoside hydrolase family 75 protein [Streptomyces lydicus]UEG92993.1 glycoside hydrolase family 75 protein [Streptomyces lydicus]